MIHFPNSRQVRPKGRGTEIVHPPREIRRKAGWSLAKMAVTAGLSVARIRAYEADPTTAALDPYDRRWLGELYAKIAEIAFP